jgi:hypothetical protein
MSRDGAVGNATGYRLDDRGVRVQLPVASRIFFTLSRTSVRPTQLPIQSKQSGREADHSPPTSAEVKKTWIYTSTPPYVFMSQCLINLAHEQLYFYIHAYSDRLTDCSFGRKRGRGVKLTTHLHLVPRSRKRGSIHPLPHTSSCRSA